MGSSDKALMDLVGASGRQANSSTPERQPDSLVSQDFFEAVLGIGVGPIWGIAPGNFGPLENLYVGETVVQNPGTGGANFNDFFVAMYPGEATDGPVQFQLGGPSYNQVVNVSLTTNVPVTRSLPSTLRTTVDRLEVRILFNQLFKNDAKGTRQSTVNFRIEYKQITAPAWNLYNGQPQISITGKTEGGAVKDFLIAVPRVDDDWEVRVTMLSPESDDDGNTASLSWESVQAVTLSAQTYDGVAVLQLYGKSSNQFSSVPQFGVDILGKMVKVPTIYNPDNRSYDTTNPWDGTFKIAYTNNPVWHLNDLCTNERYGLPAYYLTVTTNRFDFLAASQWCDELTPDGQGGQQPRFTFNEVISEGRAGLELIKYIAGAFNAIVIDDGNGVIRLVTDKPTNAVQVFCPEDIADGEFTYTFTPLDTRYNDIVAVFANPDLGYEEDRRAATIPNADHIAKFGRIPYEFVAVGCTDAGEAVRRANYRFITATTEVTTVAFTTSRFGLTTDLYDTVYIADPDSDWSMPGRIKSLDKIGQVIHLRDPIYFPSNIQRTLLLQTYDGLRQLTVLPSVVGTACYTLIIQAGIIPEPSEYPDRTVFTIEDAVSIGFAKPFKVLSIDEVEGSLDNYQITAIEVNINKYPDADSGTLSDPVKYSYTTPGEPILPSALYLDSGQAQLIQGTDGSIVHRIYAEWQRPFQAYTDHYEIDYREVNSANWITVPGITADSAFLAPVIDGSRYDVRLFAVTPAGARSRKSVDVLNYLVNGKNAIVPNVTGLTVARDFNGWMVDWVNPIDTIVDYKYTELRIGVPGNEWENVSTYATPSQPHFLLPWQHADIYRVFAKHADRSGNFSQGAAFYDFEVKLPNVPPIEAEATFSNVTLIYNDPSTSQPVVLYKFWRGDVFATAEYLGSTNALQYTVNEKVSGFVRYWIVAVDIAGNESQAGTVRIEIIPTIDDAIKQLQDGLDIDLDIIRASIISFANQASTRIVNEAGERVTGIANIQTIVDTGFEQMASNIDQLQAVVDDNIAVIVEEQNAQADQLSAQATTIETLGVQVGDQDVAIQQTSSVLADLKGNYDAKYSLVINANGRVTGILLNNSSGSPTTMTIIADKFAIAKIVDDGSVIYPFIIGSVNGVSTVGINGNLVIDGTLVGRAITANSITGDKIVAGSISAREANFGYGANILPDSSFTDRSGDVGFLPRNWAPSAGLPGSTFGVNLSSAWTPVGRNTLYLSSTSTTGNTNNAMFVQRTGINVIPGQRYEFSCYVAGHRADTLIVLAFLDANGTYLLEGDSERLAGNTYGGGSLVSGYKRIGSFVTAPSNAASAYMLLIKYDTIPGNADSYGFFTMPYVGPANPSQIAFSPYASSDLSTKIGPGGIVTPSLEALSATIGRLRTAASGARVEILDNNITGYYSNNVPAFILSA